MDASVRAAGVQAYRMILYRRAVHPELFPIRDRRTVTQGEWDLEAWIIGGSHVLRFQHQGVCATEIVTDQPLELNDKGLVAECPCVGEKDFEQPFGERVNHLATVQTEALPENLYNATYRELVEFAEERDALRCLWTNKDGVPCASIVDLQRYRKEVHAQAYHLVGRDGIVLRTQSIFEHR